MEIGAKDRVAILGYGISGKSVVRFLLNSGAEVRVSESRSREHIEQADLEELARKGIALETGGHSMPFLEGCSLVVPSPGVPLQLPVLETCRRRGIPVLGELALFADRCPVPVIAVTGANGKTTVTSLIGHLLREGDKQPFVGGNIGTPVLEYFTDDQHWDIVVLEVSSFQLDLAGRFRPQIGLLLNITQDHLDRHGSMEAYTAAKYRIFTHQRVGDRAIVGLDDALACQAPIPEGVERLGFGYGTECAARVEETGVRLALTAGGVEVYDLQDTALVSGVNRLNAAAAILAVRLAGVGREEVRRGLASYRPPPHRMAFVAQIDGVTYIDDSKATNVGALEAAVKGCADPVILIAGGRDKDSDFRQLRGIVQERVRDLILLGESAADMAAALQGTARITRVDDMEQAVNKAAAVARPGDIVLLAPGCASFDMFTGYAQRGDVFTEKVRLLADKHETREKR